MEIINFQGERPNNQYISSNKIISYDPHEYALHMLGNLVLANASER